MPRFALRFKDQVACFREQLPGHVLMIQKGVLWQVAVPGSVVPRALATKLPVVDSQRVRRSSPGSAVEERLWQSGVPVAWIGETGRRLTDIAERALVCRWAGMDRRESLGESGRPISLGCDAGLMILKLRGGEIRTSENRLHMGEATQ